MSAKHMTVYFDRQYDKKLMWDAETDIMLIRVKLESWQII